MFLMHLVPDWREAWKFISMNCMVLATAIQGTWMSLSDDMRRGTIFDGNKCGSKLAGFKGLEGILATESGLIGQCAKNVIDNLNGGLYPTKQFRRRFCRVTI